MIENLILYFALWFIIGVLGVFACVLERFFEGY